MPDDPSPLRRLFDHGARRAADAVRAAIAREPGAALPRYVAGYRGYGTPERALVLGRALVGTALPPAEAGHGRWRNLLASVQRIRSTPQPFVTVEGRVGGHAFATQADDEGFVRSWIALPRALPAGAWHDVALHGAGTPPPAVPNGRVLVPDPRAALGVISDLDDTVLQSEITRFLRAAQLLLLENARTRLPFPGVAALYRALAAGRPGDAARPVFYVSSSPWNLYDVIADFLEVRGIPDGPLLLRDWDLGRGLTSNRAHKAQAIEEIFRTYPAMRFVLVGDSGQEDPEIYRDLVRAHPGRVLAVYIRNVTPHAERVATIRALAAEVQRDGAELLLAEDSRAIAAHAAAAGWIAPEAVAAVAADFARD